jgi:hypothetical protein
MDASKMDTRQKIYRTAVADILDSDWLRKPISARSKQIAGNMPAENIPGHDATAIYASMIQALTAGLQREDMRGKACPVLPHQVSRCSETMHHDGLRPLYGFGRVFRDVQLGSNSVAVFGTDERQKSFRLLIKPLWDSFGLAEDGYGRLKHSEPCLSDRAPQVSSTGDSCASPYSVFKTNPDESKFVRGLSLYGLGTHLVLQAMPSALFAGSDLDIQHRVELLVESYIAGWLHDTPLRPSDDASYQAGYQDKANHNVFMQPRNIQLKRTLTQKAPVLWENLLEKSLFKGQALKGCVRTAFLQSLAGDVAPTPLTLVSPLHLNHFAMTAYHSGPTGLASVACRADDQSDLPSRSRQSCQRQGRSATSP